MKNYAKGGQVIAYKKDAPKFKKIDITDKYVIEAINEIGLQDVNFDKSSIDDKIKSEFEKLLDNTSEYIISEDSNAITNAIENDIQARYNQGDTEENINSYKEILNNPSQRKSQYIDEYAKTQKETINEWTSYLKQSEYPVAIKFLILKAVFNFNYDYKLNELQKRNNKTIRNFTPFDAGSLSELINLNSENLLKDYTQIQVENSAKIMQNKQMVKTSGNGTWLKFNGGRKTSEEERYKNSKELAQLVQNTYWCTKSNSKSQLDGGDFYVYVTETNGEVFPRIAIRMDEDKVGEVRGNKSASQDIEEEMLPVAEKFLTENITNGSGQKWLDGIKYNQEATNLYDKISEKGLFKNSVEEFIELKLKERQNLLDYSNRNGHIVRLEELINKKTKNLPNEFYGEKEVALNILDYDYEKTKIILGYANFVDSDLIDLGKLEMIGGLADFRFSKITDLGNLNMIGGSIDIYSSNINNLGNLKYIGGDIEFETTEITNLKNLQYIGGNANFSYCKITNLGNLQSIGGDADFQNSIITNLKNLKYIGGDAYFSNSEVTDLDSLKYIGGVANFDESKVADLGSLKSIGGNVKFSYCKITNLGNLQSIGGDADFQNSIITNLGNLEYIGANAYFTESEVIDLGQLTAIGEDANFEYSLITDLGQLTTIGGGAYFDNSQVTDLGQLTTIGGDAYFDNSKITNLKNLKYIGGDAYFSDSQVTDLGQLNNIGGNAFFNSELNNLGKLTTIGKNANFSFCKITNLGNLQSIGRDVYFDNSKITDLGNLKTIGGDVFFMGSKITDLENLTTIGGNAIFSKTKVTDLGNLTVIGGDANFRDSQVTDLGNLTTIGGNAVFYGSEIKDLGNLTTIGKHSDFRDSQVTDLGNLTTIGGDANFNNSKITDLGQLKDIKGVALFGDNNDYLQDEWKKRRMENISPSLKKLKNLKRKTNDFSIGGEVSNTNIIAQVWDWFGIKF